MSITDLQYEDMKVALAASQAREKTMHKLLNFLTDPVHVHIAGSECETCNAQKAARDFLASPVYNSALVDEIYWAEGGRDAQWVYKLKHSKKLEYPLADRIMQEVVREFGMRVAQALQDRVDAGRSTELADLVDTVMDRRCSVASSVTGQPCLLTEGHAADSPTRFHRYAKPEEQRESD